MAGLGSEADETPTETEPLTTVEELPVAPVPPLRKWNPETEPPADARAAARRAARLSFRRYCLACGRSTDGTGSEERNKRCPSCGGTMLTEPVSD
jgi:DNA-directed RNA polymerase subunit RPC12/RpoP